MYEIYELAIGLQMNLNLKWATKGNQKDKTNRSKHLTCRPTDVNGTGVRLFNSLTFAFLV